MPAASRNPFPRVIDRLAYIAIKGTVLALERTTGVEIWRCKLKGGQFVNLHFDGEDLFATTMGEIWCIDPATGNVRWNNRLKGMGYGLVTIATRGGSAGSGGNSPAMVAHLHRQRDTAIGAAAAGGVAASAAG